MSTSYYTRRVSARIYVRGIYEEGGVMEEKIR